MKILVTGGGGFLGLAICKHLRERGDQVRSLARGDYPGLAYAVGTVMEIVYKILPLGDEPPMTRFLARQLSTAHWYDISTVRRDLGYEPTVSIDESLERLSNHLRAE